MPPKTRYKSTTGKGRVNVGKEPKQREWGANKPSAPPGEKGGGGFVAPSKPKPLVSKPSAPPGEKGGGGTGLGSKVLGGVSTAALAVGTGVQTRRTIKDIKKINKWTGKVKNKFGKSYTDLGRKVNPALMAKTSGSFLPSKIFSKTGYPAGIKNWWMARSSPTHFAGAEKFVNPALKIVGKVASKLLGPASWLISTPANANEDERMSIINEQWDSNKIYASGKGPDADRPSQKTSIVPEVKSLLGVSLDTINTNDAIITDENPAIQKEIKINIGNTLNQIAKENLSDNSYKVISASAAVANIALVKKEFKVNLNDSSNITAKWKDGVSLMYNLEF